jgi:hypothetical protein
VRRRKARHVIISDYVNDAREQRGRSREPSDVLFLHLFLLLLPIGDFSSRIFFVSFLEIENSSDDEKKKERLQRWDQHRDEEKQSYCGSIIIYRRRRSGGGDEIFPREREGPTLTR